MIETDTVNYTGGYGGITLDPGQRSQLNAMFDLVFAYFNGDPLTDQQLDELEALVPGDLEFRFRGSG